MIEVKEITVTSEKKKIIERVNFSIRRGDVSLVVGPNGSGKSTLFKAIMGLLRVKTGKIYADGLDITTIPVHERFSKGIALAPEKMRVAPNLTVEDNLKIGAKMDVSLAYEMFPQLRKLRKQRAGTLSGGERQMVVFSRAILSKPKYLLLDEPFQGLQKEVRNRIIDEISSMKNRKTGIAIISHERLEELIDMSDTLTLLIAGKVVFSEKIETSEEIFDKLGKYLMI